MFEFKEYIFKVKKETLIGLLKVIGIQKYYHHFFHFFSDYSLC